MLVAASPNDQISDTHWYRADFDYFLVRQAQEMGVDYFDEARLTGLSQDGGNFTLHGLREEHKLRISAKFLIDASGPRGFLHRTLEIDEIDLPNFPATQSLYNHFTEVERLDQPPSAQPTNSRHTLSMTRLYITSSMEAGYGSCASTMA